jgi:hypothetical protein
MTESRQYCKVSLVLVLLISLLLMRPVRPAYAAGTLVDSFDTNQGPVMSVGATSCSTVDSAGTDILGTERDMAVGNTSGSGIVYAQTDSGRLSHSQGDFKRGWTELQWDGNEASHSNCPDDIDYTGLGGVVLNSGGADRFVVEVITKDVTGGSLVITVYTDSSNWATYTENLDFTGAKTLSIPFASFAGGSGTLDWGNVGAIVVKIDGSTVDSLDMSIDFFGTNSPTAIDLASFTAAPAGRSIQLQWETATELDNLGFNLYRAEAADGPWTKLNASLIPAQAPGSPVGATYTFEDANITRGATYYYRLEDLDVYGQSQFHGPVSATSLLIQRTLLRPRLDAGLTKK